MYLSLINQVSTVEKGQHLRKLFRKQSLLRYRSNQIFLLLRTLKSLEIGQSSDLIENILIIFGAQFGGDSSDDLMSHPISS